MANYIKLLTALAGLALLAACGGTPTVNIGEININNGETCDTNPYGADCGEEFATERQTIAEDCRTNGEGEFCADAIESVCPTNVNDRICDNTPKYVEQRVTVVVQCTDTKTQTECDDEDRMTACDANEFAANCPEQKYIDKRKMTCTGEKTSDRCKPTVALICGTDGDIFDAFCTGLPTTGADRISACQTHGITKSAGGDSTCDGLISAACVMDPFEHTGCATLNNYSTALVPDFCAKDANIFAQEDCGKLGNIGDLRNMYCTPLGKLFNEMCISGNHRNDLRMDVCTDTNIFHEGCLGDAHGGKTERDTACQTHGITEPMGDASCDERIRTDCVMDPFDATKLGCRTLGDIANLDNNFCRNTSANTGKNPFHDRCNEPEETADRKTACLLHGLTASSTLCDGIIRPDCVMKPFDNAGCATLGDYSSNLVPTFCRDTNTDTGKNPFHSMCNEPEETADRKTACLLHGLTASSTLCDGIIRPDCVMKPFDNAGCATLGDYSSNLVPTFCRDTNTDTGKNPFHSMCNEPEETTDRRTACEVHGLLASPTLCDGIIRTDCESDPFDYAGCTTLSGGTLRMTFCTTTDIFNVSCRDGMNGGDTQRESACQTHGTNEVAGGHPTCDASEYYGIRTACTSNPDEYLGCATLTGEFRRTLCTTTDIFHATCLDDTNGGKTERDNACLMNGTGDGGHSSCLNRSGFTDICKMNPFNAANPGCEDIPTINTFIRIIYCAGGREIEGIADGSDTPECKVNYADWQGGFTGTLTETAVARTNKFLQNITTTGPEERRSLNLNTATFDGDKLGRDVNSGVVFYSTGTLADTTHFAGILAGTNLGRRLETTSGTGQWNGSFWATNMETATDFTLHIDFVSRDIAGIVRNGTTDNYYFVEGVYANGGNSGLITGMVQYGAFSATAIDLTTATPTLPIPSGTPTGGILSGIIGSNGAIGVFVSGSAVDADGLLTGGTGVNGFAGGFVVNPTAQVSLTVDYNDWARGFNNVSPPATATITPDRLNQFLNAGEDRLAAANGNAATSSLDFNDIHDDNDTDNGVAWFSVEDDPNRYHYAGVFETTDLGVPVTGKTATTAMWSGQFQTGAASAVAFDLEVTFGNAGVGEIAAFVASGDNHYLLGGTYDAKGIIKGEVNFGEFTDSERTTPTDAVDIRKGVLSGIIGSNGAVGVFTSGTMISADGVIMGGTDFNSGYVGGFVASPIAGKVSYRDWVRLANPTPNNSPIITDGSPLNQFLKATGNVLNKGRSYTRTETNVNMSRLNGDPNDGFSVYQTAQGNYFAGISSTTSLGAVLPHQQMFNGDADAEWDGKFLAYEFEGAVVHDFKLMVDFANSEISATDVAGYSFTDVAFDANGVVSQGTITHTATTSTGLLQGLIGQDGAVGVFYSDGSNLFSYGGGFVAVANAPTVIMPEMPDMEVPEGAIYSIFRAHYNLQTVDPTARGFSFVDIGATGLSTTGLNFVDFTHFKPFAPFTVKLGGLVEGDVGFGDNVDGFAIMVARFGETLVSRRRAGLLPTTDLGLALDNTVQASWTGNAYSSSYVDSAKNNVPISIPLTLTVDFDNGTITSPEITTPSGNQKITINGRFGAGRGLAAGTPAGILGGTVDYRVSAFNNYTGLQLIGLIGADGALGVFGNDGLVGGFEARPTQ